MQEKGPVKAITLTTQRLLQQLQRANDSDLARAGDEHNQSLTIPQSTFDLTSNTNIGVSSTLEENQPGLQTNVDSDFRNINLSEFIWFPDLDDYFTSSFDSLV